MICSLGCTVLDSSGFLDCFDEPSIVVELIVNCDLDFTIDDMTPI